MGGGGDRPRSRNLFIAGLYRGVSLLNRALWIQWLKNAALFDHNPGQTTACLLVPSCTVCSTALPFQDFSEEEQSLRAAFDG